MPLEEARSAARAGTWRLTQPEMSGGGRRKMDHRIHGRRVATGNVGYILESRKVKERGRAIEVVHPVDLLTEAQTRF